MQTFLYGRDVLIYTAAVPIILLLFSSILALFHDLLDRGLFRPCSAGLYSLLMAGGRFLRSVVGAMTQVPKAAFYTFLIGMALNFLVYYYPSPQVSVWMNDSGVYQSLYQQVLCPVLNSNLAKNIPVIINDTMDKVIPGTRDVPDAPLSPDSNHGLIIKYFNGVTLDQAIKSNAEIDRTARMIVGREQNSTRQAYLIYQWVASNIKYDYDKALQVSQGTSGVDSGSIIAYNTRTGICFDYSCLYISMCRAVGLKVRLITGLGYSGTAWGDHAWNQVYSPTEGRWINVDTTFGSNGNYFDKPDFMADHRHARVQGEW
jgi:transglutaminase-like putative cysteine protease